MKKESINPMDIFEKYGTQHAALTAALNEIGDWGIGQAHEFATMLGMDSSSFNTYEDPDFTAHHDRVIQYHVVSPSGKAFDHDSVLVVVEEHGGGDVRGNYLDAKVYRVTDIEGLYSELFCDPEEFDEE
jgi:hypothetical protein